MKNPARKYIGILFMAACFVACDNLDNNPGIISGELTYSSECKNTKSATDVPIYDTISCIEYFFNAAEQTLTLNHINAAFNCCPGELSSKIEATDNVITITESEETSDCKCNCLYDLTISITGVQKQSYTLKIIEPHLSNEDKLSAEIDLTTQEEGSFCVVRKNYPWAISSATTK